MGCSADLMGLGEAGAIELLCWKFSAGAPGTVSAHAHCHYRLTSLVSGNPRACGCHYSLPSTLLQLFRLLDQGQACVVMGKEHELIKFGRNERLIQTPVHPPGFQLMLLGSSLSLISPTSCSLPLPTALQTSSSSIRCEAYRDCVTS